MSTYIRIADAGVRSMLHLAAQRGNVPVIENILEAARDFYMNHNDSRGRTALHYVVKEKRAAETVTALVSGATIYPYTSAYSVMWRSPWDTKNFENSLLVLSLDEGPLRHPFPVLAPNDIFPQTMLVETHTLLTSQ